MGKNLSKAITCGHCYNIAPMEAVGNVNHHHRQETDSGPDWEYSDVYEVLICPRCEKINITSYFWHDFMDSEDEISYKVLYPQSPRLPQGLPPNILKTYQSAEQIKAIDPEIYAISLRKILELVCLEKGAEGKFLAHKLNDLATRGEIPKNLVKVAEGIKDFGNIGAHAGIGNLSAEEIPIAEALCKAVLEYIYSAPYIASLAEKKLETIKSAKKVKPK